MNYSIIRLIGIISTFATITSQTQAMQLSDWPVKTTKSLTLEGYVNSINTIITNNIYKSKINRSYYLNIIEHIQATFSSLPDDIKKDLATILAKEWADRVFTVHNSVITHFDGRQLSHAQRKLNPILGTNASCWLELSFDQLITRYISVCVAKKNCLAYPFQLIPVPQCNERSVSPQYNVTDIPNLEAL